MPFFSKYVYIVFSVFLLLESIELNKNEKIENYVETLEVDQLKLDKKINKIQPK